jgi:hypothetical protein
MQPLGEYLVNDRLRERFREAETERLAAASRRTPSPQMPAWRRGGAGAARWLSRTAGSVAVTLDPSLCRPSYGRE